MNKPIKKFTINSKGLENFYIKNGYLLVGNVFNSKFINKLSKFFLSSIKRKKKIKDYHDLVIKSWMALKMKNFMRN